MGVPPQMKEFMESVRGMAYEDVPDYDKLDKLLEVCTHGEEPSCVTVKSLLLADWHCYSCSLVCPSAKWLRRRQNTADVSTLRLAAAPVSTRHCHAM